MLKLTQTVVVEGKYDKIKLSSVIDATIIETNGFRIFSDEQKLELLRTLAKKNGIIIMTDSDFAGFRIRNYLKNKISNGEIIHAFLPDRRGKEKRKSKASKEGLLGVEGFTQDEILTSLKNAGVTTAKKETQSDERITKLDLYNLGLSGKKNSSEKRSNVLKRLNLPLHLSPSVLPNVISTVISKDEFIKLVKSMT